MSEQQLSQRKEKSFIFSNRKERKREKERKKEERKKERKKRKGQKEREERDVEKERKKVFFFCRETEKKTLLLYPLNVA